MKKIKQIIIEYDDRSFKGYNYNGFKASIKEQIKEWLKEEQDE